MPTGHVPFFDDAGSLTWLSHSGMGTHTPLLPLSLLWVTWWALGILFCMKETHLLSIWKIYIINILIVKRWGETTHGARSGRIMACVWRSDKGFVESVISSLYMGSGDWNQAIKLTQHQGLLSTKPSHWPHHFHFYISWVSDLEVSCLFGLILPTAHIFGLTLLWMTSSTSTASLSPICSSYCKF